MKNIFYSNILLLLLISGFTEAKAQQENPPLYINVLVDAEHQIFILNRKIKFEEIAATVKKYVYNQPAMKYEGVVYRIFGDESLKLGNIMDVENELRKGFTPVRTRRYLLNLKEKEIDGNNYIQKLEKLDLKAIEH